MQNSIEVEWLVAVLAPWTISPHPNFSEDSVSAPSQLALVTERRYRRERERFTDETRDATSWQQQLVTQAEASLAHSTQVQATASLWELSHQALPAAARAAAALYASVGAFEREQSDEAHELLLRLAEELTGGATPIEGNFSASFRLVVSAILQQRVLRLLDSCRYEEARGGVRDVLAWVPVAKERGFDDFPVSQGISWSASRVQNDIARAIRSRAMSARTSLDFPTGQTWVQMVKSRTGWIDSRSRSVGAKRDGYVLRDEYEAMFESTSGTQHFMRATATDAGYEALLLSELSGHHAQCRIDRENLGKIVMLSQGSGIDEPHAQEALRLLRQAGATGSLRSALNWMRNQGPTSAVLEDALAIVNRSELQKWTTEPDLQVLGAAAEFMTRSQRERAIKVSFTALATGQSGMNGGWSLHDKTWKAVGLLTPESGADDLVLGRMSSYLEQPHFLTEPLVGTLARVVDSLEWARISRDLSGPWEKWATQTEETVETRELHRAVQAHLVRPEDLLPSKLSLERAAYLADNGLPSSEPAWALKEMAQYLLSLLASEADAARKGTYSFGGYTTSNVAVAYALRFKEPEFWSGVVGFLVDPAIDVVLKKDAIDRLVRFEQDVPSYVKSELIERADDLLGSRRENQIFSSARLPVFAEAVRLLGVLGAIPPEIAIAHVMTLAAGNDVARIEAAKTVPYVMKDDYSTWGHSLLLQISNDPNPLVRAEAATSLVLSLAHSSVLIEMVKGRILELLESDGLRTPAFIMNASRRVAESDANAVHFLLQAVKVRARSETPRVLHQIATDTLGALTSDV